MDGVAKAGLTSVRLVGTNLQVQQMLHCPSLTTTPGCDPSCEFRDDARTQSSGFGTTTARICARAVSSPLFAALASTAPDSADAGNVIWVFSANTEFLVLSCTTTRAKAASASIPITTRFHFFVSFVRIGFHFQSLCESYDLFFSFIE
jgi:hypothetical protein